MHNNDDKYPSRPGNGKQNFFPKIIIFTTAMAYRGVILHLMTMIKSTQCNTCPYVQLYCIGLYEYTCINVFNRTCIKYIFKRTCINVF